MRTLIVMLWVIAAAAPVAGQRPPPTWQAPRWRPVFRGIQVARLALSEPFPIQAVAARVDLDEPNLSLVVTPGNGDAPRETTGLKTSHFLRRHRCQLAINAGPFSPVAPIEGRPHDVRGLQVAAGQLVSPAAPQTPVLVIDRSGRALVCALPPPLASIRHAVPGFEVVLRAGQVTGARGTRHPRTAAGVSADGRVLILLVVDGRQAASRGATTAEVGGWLRDLGAANGINLDGGATSTMAIADAAGQPRLLNRPVHLKLPGLERPAGSHLGIRAAPLR